MPPLAAFAPQIIAGAGSLIGGALAGRSRTQTNTSTTNATYSPETQQVMARLATILTKRLNKGKQVKQGDRDAGRTSINETYDAILPRVEGDLTARGFGESGKLGQAILGLQIARANQFQKLESQLQDDAETRYQNTINQALAFAHPTGSTTNSTTTLPGQGIGGTIAGFGTDLATMIYLNKLLKGGGGGGGLTLDAGDSAGLGDY